ncbi:fibronectin-binding protein A, N-terminal domain protein [Peptoniphilus sp. oral taxon 375 str. F0436]|nr:fibronectin-binding protein A, N-terminal domain protein [Peptoniphilus sp. oral taxon 375 str. F0436]
MESPENKTFQQFLITSYMGISKTLTREINFRAGLDEALPKSALDSEDQEKLLKLAYDFFQEIKKKNYLFAIYEDLEDEKILDFSNLPLTMYGSGSQVYDSPSELLENVYTQRAEKDLIQQKSADLRKI